MINFTVGPVTSFPEIREVAKNQIPYFRTTEFSEIMFQNESMILKLAGAPTESRAVFLTGSGTAAMEASLTGFFDRSDNLLVVDGGSFGHRFVQLCELHEIPHSTITLSFGQSLSEDILQQYESKGFTGFVVNLCDTSTGILYDIDLITSFCHRNGCMLLVDAISAFLADPINMEKSGIDILITGSQKALACDPGVSVVMMNSKALSKSETIAPHSMYLSIKEALSNGTRGQTPFTPAVGILLEINARLKSIISSGGYLSESHRIGSLAEYFRNKITDYPFVVPSIVMSNSVTPVFSGNISAHKLFEILKDEYEIWICPNGGELRDTVFRVGHLGNLTTLDYDNLFEAFSDLIKRGILS